MKEKGNLIVAYATEFGDLDFDSNTNGGGGGGHDAWDDELNVDEIDQVLKAQKQQERAEKQKQRLLEHEKRHHQKKKVAGD
uniref:Uncharacterized protein n=1 Tax=Panagrolaimus sp. ES5 TaxID=591445 RepID=A0AC34GY71_9BILA